MVHAIETSGFPPPFRLLLLLVPLVVAGCSCDSDASYSVYSADASDASHDAKARDAPDGAHDSVVPDARNATDATPQIDATDAPTDVPLVPDGGDASDADASPEPVSLFCGDAIRDPVTEECDDGPGDELDSCTSECRVRDVSVTVAEPADAGPRYSRTLGAGRHVASGSRQGFAVVYTEEHATSAIWLQAYDSRGRRRGAPVDAARGGVPTGVPNPVVAALPGDHFAVAWNDVTQGTPDVALRSIAPGESATGTPVRAHDGSAGFQGDADLLWTGTELIAAWTDGFDLKWRSFGEGLAPNGGEQNLATSAAFESNVALAPAESGWAAAWRAGDLGLETVHVKSKDVEWKTEVESPGPEGDHPALVMLDATRFLLVYSIGEYADGGTSSVGRLRVAVLDSAAPGTVAGKPLEMRSPPAASRRLEQRRPAAMRADGRVFLAWEMENPSTVPFLSDVWLEEVAIAPDGSLDVRGEWRVPGSDTAAGNQQNPSLGVSPTVPGNALLLLWEDVGGDRSRGADRDFTLRFRPVPFVDLPSPGDAAANDR
jgi:hypothetical protein